MSLAFLALALVMVVGVRRSRTGRVLVAIRENERAALSYGVNATRTTLAAFAMSGFLAAMAGALYVHQQQGLAVEPFLTQRSLELFSMVVIGGLGSLPGAVLGAVYVRSADFFLPARLAVPGHRRRPAAVLLLLPSGLGGLLADMRDGALRRVARRRGIVVPSLLADVRVVADEDTSLEDAVAAAKAEDDARRGRPAGRRCPGNGSATEPAASPTAPARGRRRRRTPTPAVTHAGDDRRGGAAEPSADGTEATAAPTHRRRPPRPRAAAATAPAVRRPRRRWRRPPSSCTRPAPATRPARRGREARRGRRAAVASPGSRGDGRRADRASPTGRPSTR